MGPGALDKAARSDGGRSRRPLSVRKSARGPASGGLLGRLALIAAVAGLCMACAAGGTADGARPGGRQPSARDRELLGDLHRGGHVLLLRYNPVGNPGGAGPPAGARAVGQSLQELGVPVGRVLASPDPRALGAARAAFGPRRVETTDAIASRYLHRGGALVEEPGPRMRGLLSASPPKGENTVLVGVYPEPAAPEETEGEAAVFEPLGDGDFRRVALIAPGRWAEFPRGRDL